jgi:hypothetical protein
MEQQLDYCQADLELKTVDLSQRIISGYACVHSTVDKVHDIIDPSASAKAVARLGSPSDIAVFVGHATNTLPVGIPKVIEATPQGLYTETYILKGSEGDNLLAVARDLLEHGQSLGMSIGYKTKDSRHESIGGPGAGKTRRVRRLLDFELREYSFAAQQAIAHPEAIVSAVKALAASSAPRGKAIPPTAVGCTGSALASTPPSELTASSGVSEDGAGASAVARKTGAADSDPARAARREQARAELERCDREARRAQAETEVRRALLDEFRARSDALGSYIVDLRRRQVDEQIREREERERQQKELMQRLRDVVNTPKPRTRAQMEESVQQLERESVQRQAAEQDRLWHETDRALTRRTWDWAFRRSWDARHPGGPDKCGCDGCRAWRRKPPR